MNTAAHEILNETKHKVLPNLRKYLKIPPYSASFEIPAQHKHLSQFHLDMISDYPERQGKYLRPTLLMLTCEAMGGDISKAINTAVSMQISEDWLLIHDDIEDDSEQRRGKAALHRLYGNELAINAGDSLHIIMWKAINDNYGILPIPKAKAIADEFYKMLSRTALGQTVEIHWTKTNKIDLSPTDWFFLSDGKTSYYTIAGPMKLGAILADATPSQLNQIDRFGLCLGRCFQIVDDILDLTSDFSGLKKQKANDIYEGKRTLITCHLFQNANSKDKEKLITIFGKNRADKTEPEVDWVLNKIHQYGSLDYAHQIAKDFQNQAHDIFKNNLTFLSSQPARNKLETLLHFITERKS